jgi:hypothetical protein
MIEFEFAKGTATRVPTASSQVSGHKGTSVLDFQSLMACYQPATIDDMGYDSGRKSDGGGE